MIYRYIYKITCTTGSLKDKFYFGQHTTKNLNDSYKGSGKLIKDYYKKHPNDYIKEIISYHNSQEELNQAEHDIIKPWLNTSMCLNICEGGMGGSFHHTEETKRKISESHKGKSPANKGLPAWNRGMKGYWHPTDEQKQKHSLSLKGRVFTDEHRKNISNSLKGHIISEETRNKISKSHKESYVKRIWVNKANNQKWIPINEYQKYISDGWKKGRK